MIDDDRGQSWRRSNVAARARACARLATALVERSAEVVPCWSAAFSLSEEHVSRYELPAAAAALDELARAAPRVLDARPTRRWFFGERAHARVEPLSQRAIVVDDRASPGALVAWCACAFVVGSESAVQCSKRVAPALSLLASCVEGDEPWPLVLDHGPEATSAVRAPSALTHDGLVAPSLAWIDDAAAVDRCARSLLRAARYAGGDRRGALRWVCAPPAVIERLSRALAPIADRFELGAVHVTRGPWSEAHRASPSTLVLEEMPDERGFVEDAKASGPWSAACGFGSDAARARSIALRTMADSVFVNSAPAEALGGLLRAEFIAEEWLALATRTVVVSEGPCPSVARADEGEDRSRWLRRAVRWTLGRYGIGGSIADLW